MLATLRAGHANCLCHDHYGTQAVVACRASADRVPLQPPVGKSTKVKLRKRPSRALRGCAGAAELRLLSSWTRAGATEWELRAPSWCGDAWAGMFWSETGAACGVVIRLQTISENGTAWLQVSWCVLAHQTGMRRGKLCNGHTQRVMPNYGARRLAQGRLLFRMFSMFKSVCVCAGGWLSRPCDDWQWLVSLLGPILHEMSQSPGPANDEPQSLG